MAFINKYPYTDQHELNLDWFLTQFAKLSNEWEGIKPFIPSINQTYTTPEAFGAIGDGITDDTVAIQNAINSKLPIIFADKTYCINAGIGIKCIDGTVILMRPDTILKGINITDDSQIIHVKDCKNVLIAGGIIDGNRLLSHSQDGHGLRLETAHNVTILNTVIKNCRGDGLYVGSKYTNDHWTIVYPSSNIYVDNIHISDCGRNGISIVACNGIKVCNSVIRDIHGESPEAGIDVEVNNDAYPVTDYYFENLIIENCNKYELIIPRANENGFIHGCKLDGSFRLERGKNIIVSNCVVTGLTEIDGIDGNDKYLNNSLIGFLVINQSADYKLYVNNCKIGERSVALSESSIYTNSRTEDISGKCSLVITGCDITGTSAKSVMNFTRYLKSLKISQSTIHNFTGRPELNATEKVEITSTVFDGGRVTCDYAVPLLIFTNNVLSKPNLAVYGYIIGCPGVFELHINNNIMLGDKTESAFVKANYGLNPTGSISFNDISKYDYAGLIDASASVKQVSNIVRAS